MNLIDDKELERQLKELYRIINNDFLKKEDLEKVNERIAQVEKIKTTYVPITPITPTKPPEASEKKEQEKPKEGKKEEIKKEQEPPKPEEKKPEKPEDKKEPEKQEKKLPEIKEIEKVGIPLKKVKFEEKKEEPAKQPDKPSEEIEKERKAELEKKELERKQTEEEKKKLEAERAEKERLKLEAEQKEKDRIAKEKADQEEKERKEKERIAQELAKLRDEIGKLSLNETERQRLNNAKDKTQAEQVKTDHNTRIAKEEAERKEKQRKEQAELAKYDALLNKINDPNKKTFTSLPENYEAEAINNLINDLLPTGKKNETLNDRIKERRASFVYSLDRPEDGGLTSEQYQKALATLSDEKKIWKATPKNPITVKILNELLGLTPANPSTIQDLTEYFRSKGGYELTLPEQDRQHSLLADCYNRISLGGENFSKISEYFCEKEVDPEKGVLPFPTGAGKSTTVPACFFGYLREWSEEKSKNIIIVAPTASLVQAIYDSHDDWLQQDKSGNPFVCPYHRKAHGKYKTAINDLTYYDSIIADNEKRKMVRKEGQGEKGISVMEPQVLLAYLVRDIIKIGAIKCDNVSEKERINEAKKAVKAKLINPKETIIYFDESHFTKDGSTTYTKIQELAQKLGYNTMRATATFKGKPFSISMPHKIERKYMSGLVEKYQDKEGNEVNLNKWMASGKLLVFLPKAELTKEQEIILKRENVGYLVLDETVEKFSTDIIRNCPDGYSFFGDDRYGIGFTFLINTCISLMELELKKLIPGWKYSRTKQPLSDASLTQQSGRVARTSEGKFIATGQRTPQDANFTKNPDPKDDLASLMVEAVLGKDTNTEAFKSLASKYPSLCSKGLELLQGAIALPSEDNKWRYPEEILVGLTQGNPNYPKLGVKPSTATPDLELWAKHEGTYKPKEIEKGQAKQLLFLMIENAVSKLKTFPQKIQWDLETPLIKQVGYKVNDSNAIAEVKKAVLGAVAKGIPSKNEYKEKELNEFKKSVELLKHLTLYEEKLKIEIIQEYEDRLKNPKNAKEGKKEKENLTLKINYE